MGCARHAAHPARARLTIWGKHQMRHAASTRKARRKSSTRPKISGSIFDQNRSRLLMASALGLCSLAMTGHAQACNPNQTLGDGAYGYSWSICNGDNGDGDNKNG